MPRKELLARVRARMDAYEKDSKRQQALDMSKEMQREMR